MCNERPFHVMLSTVALLLVLYCVSAVWCVLMVQYFVGLTVVILLSVCVFGAQCPGG